MTPLLSRAQARSPQRPVDIVHFDAQRLHGLGPLPHLGLRDVLPARGRVRLTSSARTSGGVRGRGPRKADDDELGERGELARRARVRGSVAREEVEERLPGLVFVPPAPTQPTSELLQSGRREHAPSVIVSVVRGQVDLRQRGVRCREAFEAAQVLHSSSRDATAQHYRVPRCGADGECG